MYAIMGATGNIGRKVANILLDKGESIRVIGRSAKKLHSFITRGVEAAVGDAAETEFLTRAFKGAKVVFTVIPPNYTTDDFLEYCHAIGESIATAIQHSGIQYVVNLSGYGAHLPDGTGLIKGLYAQEQQLNRLEHVHILHLRPTYVMENLLMNMDIIKNWGVNGSAVNGELKIAMIATQDITKVAAEHLLNLDFSGKTVNELLGQRDISLNEATKIIGKKIGDPYLDYVQFPYEDFRKGLLELGFSKNVSHLFVEMNQAFNDGLYRNHPPRTPENTTETSFEVFANYFAQVYHKFDLDYVQSFYEDLEKGVEDVGFSEDVSRLLDGMPESYNSDLLDDSLHRIHEISPRTAPKEPSELSMRAYAS